VAHKRPYRSRLLGMIADCVMPDLAKPGVNNPFRARLATDTAVRTVVLRTVMPDGRIILTDMTPEQAIDIGLALICRGQEQGNANLRHGNGFIVNEAHRFSDWTVATASRDYDLLKWPKAKA
jgi:hypothetical protein